MSEFFRIFSGVRQGIISLWRFSVLSYAVMKEVKMGMGRRGESGDSLLSCMQMTCFYVVSQRNTRG